MSVETTLKMKVGSCSEATNSVASIRFVDGGFEVGDRLTIGPVNLIYGEESFEKTGTLEELAAFVKAKIDSSEAFSLSEIDGLLLTITSKEKGADSNNVEITTTNGDRFFIEPFSGGLDDNLPVDFSLQLDQNGYILVTLQEKTIIKVPFDSVFSANKKTFRQNLLDFMRKTQ